MAKTIIVSNRLPVTVNKETDGALSFSPSTGGLATGLSSIYKEGDNLWIGWPGTYGHDEDEKDNISFRLKLENMAPVFLTEEDVEKYYEGFSNRTIWPLFHYFTEYTRYEEDLWDAYQKVNEKFCNAILKHAEDGDVIWVHDYQLLLLPDMLRQKLPNATIGFFQHIPFPSFEIFRLLPWRNELLKGILGADLIGFHTYDDMRHFMSSVSRTLGYGNTLGVLKVGSRMVAVDAFPMGIDYEKFEKAAVSKETQLKLAEFKNTLTDHQSILSIDRLDYSKGIKHRLHAFDKFLTEYPEYQGKVSLILLVVPSRDKVDQYQQLKEEIDTIVGNLDGKYSRMNWTPIHYFYRSLDFPSLTALYTLSSVALVTPLRDGMNLVCKEYVASKVKDNMKGVLILSEMAGAAKELSEAILINPNDQKQMVEAIRDAVTMPLDEQENRLKDMQNKLKRYNVHKWVERFMEQLDEIKEKQKSLNLRLLSENRKSIMLEDFSKAKKRIIFLDYDGTLKGFSPNPQDVYPDDELLDILKKLCANPKNRVVIISGRDKGTLEDWMKGLKLDIIAEHGIWMRKSGGEFEIVDDLKQDWQQKIEAILERYVDRTPGSFIEYKDYSMVWHYRNADPEFGDLRARELVSNLNYMISNLDLQTMQGNKVIEIKSQDINKGKTARRFLSDEEYDFIFAAGDDVTDEDTFEQMPEEAYTIKVGLSASEAKLNVRSIEEIRSLLIEFASS